MTEMRFRGKGVYGIGSGQIEQAGDFGYRIDGEQREETGGCAPPVYATPAQPDKYWIYYVFADGSKEYCQDIHGKRYEWIGAEADRQLALFNGGRVVWYKEPVTP